MSRSTGNEHGRSHHSHIARGLGPHAGEVDQYAHPTLPEMLPQIVTQTCFTDDDFKLGGETEWHTGKRVEKSWGFQFGRSRSSTGGGDPELGLKPGALLLRDPPDQDPLFGWLQSHGWSHKGFLRRLFEY